jgi:hypothetical protein
VFLTRWGFPPNFAQVRRRPRRRGRPLHRTKVTPRLFGERLSGHRVARDDRGVADGLLFEDVADALRGMVPGDLGELHYSHHRYGIKVWFGADKPPREHYEAQLFRPGDRTVETTLSLEVGFHSEHPKENDNEAVISGLLGSERAWRRELGREAEVGGFLGAAQNWRRVSEVWPDPDLGDPELAFEVAARLTDYVTTLEPHRRRVGGRPPR